MYATGQTPMRVDLKSSDGYFSRAEYYVELVKAGYKPITVPVTFKIEGWYFANILLGGLIGMVIVDPATGAMWKLPADYLKVDLANPDAPASIMIVSLDDADEDMKKAMVPLQ